MPGWLSPWELLILLAVVLLVFGPKRLPEMGRSLGKGMREFKNSLTGKDDAPQTLAEPEAPEPEASGPAATEPPARQPDSAPRDRDAVG